jgi:hypothetical protein
MSERINTVTEGWYGPARIRHETALRYPRAIRRGTAA